MKATKENKAGMSFAAIIPARGGSKRIEKKNLRPLLGKPLVLYTIEQVLDAERIDRVFVSTEDREIAALSAKAGAGVIPRPPELALDTTSTEEVMIDAVKQLQGQSLSFTHVVLLQPTSPLRYSSDINGAIREILGGSDDSLLSVCRNSRFLWSRDLKPLNYDCRRRPRSQDKEWELVENGSIYITRVETLLKERNRLGGKIACYEQPEECGFEIDTEFDWGLLEFLMRKFYLPGKLGQRLSEIRLFLMDLDGVLTDGGVYYDSGGERLLRFSRLDGMGIELLKAHGYGTGVISSEGSEIARVRLEKLGIEHVFLSCKEKAKAVESIMAKVGVSEREVLFIGDDLQDLPVLERVGFSASPSNGVEAVKEKVLYRCERSGGSGAVREVVDLLLGRARAKGESHEDTKDCRTVRR